jgi:hypothetical protein
MKNNKDEIIFGARRAGVTWLHSFPDRAALETARSSAKRLRTTLSQLLCGPSPRDPPDAPRKFTLEDRESPGLKIQITDCDEFTRRALERHAASQGVSVEQYIVEASMCVLAGDEERAFLDPETGKVISSSDEFGRFIGCKIDENALEPSVQFTRIPIPRLAIVESC